MRPPAMLVLSLAACGPAAPPPAAPVASVAPEAASAEPSASPTEAAPAASSAAPAPSTPAPSAGGSVLLGEIAAPKSFDPRPALESFNPQLLSCYNQVRAAHPALHGKLDLRVIVNEAGSVVNVGAHPGGSANDPALVACIGEAMKALTFPKAGGSATITVPLVFRR
jgi:hypothetical protein